jgi:hypothetical protein
MLDVRQVLARKERDLERLRREVEALLRVIPLLEEKPSVPAPAEDLAKKRLPAPKTEPAETNKRGMAELELYYPFIGRSSKRR